MPENAKVLKLIAVTEPQVRAIELSISPLNDIELARIYSNYI